MSPKADLDLAERIKECAKLAGGIAELCRKTGIPRRSMDNYVIGRSPPKLEPLVHIAKASGVSLEWLATGEGSIKRDETPQPSTVQFISGDFDQQLMKECIVATVEVLDAFEKTLPPNKLAEFIILLYASELEDRENEERHLSASNIVHLFKKFS